MDTTTADPLVGQLIDGRYRVDARVARGGMATVYRAFDTRLDRIVALKVMHDSLAQDDAFVERFKREAKSAARLQHPNVVAIFDQGEDAGRVYLVMELVSGRTLRSVLREQGRLDVGQALGVAEGLLTALAAAHDAGIVHRDVKPENVLVTESGQVKVADFGLARAIESTHHTVADGTLIGTVAYLAPEQVLTGAADARTDIYSAGIVLYEMLTGAVPFTGDIPINVAYQHVNDDVPPPSATERTLPAMIDALVVDATRRPPEQRYPDVQTMLAAVRRANAMAGADTSHYTSVVSLADAPTTVLSLGRAPAGAPPRDAGSPAPKVRRRRRAPLVLAILAGLILGTAGAVGWWFGSGRYEDAPTFERLTQEAAQARAAELDVDIEIKEPSPFDEVVPRGTVIDQDPEPGARFRRGTAITLTISRGPDRVAIPDVRGKTEAQARALLVAQRLDVVLAPLEFHREVPAGTVIDQNPGPRAIKDVKPSTAVTLIVSKGPEPATVPAVEGRTRADAEKLLSEAGLVAKVVETFDDKVPAGIVIRQDRAGGSTAARGDTVTLTVSKGPELVTVPDVEGRRREEAQTLLQAAGFRVRFVEFPGRRGKTVIDQNPAGGERRRRGTVVTCFLF
ncbi:MAG TPA: Stk1 family PASTA domain-containing Ser/Thr kinase [Mycobacteriales bacterium]|nr:Stk1 family PASTA domain-containing Ser/Thr kinase [Mycobacteriales bacterium]